MYMYMYVCVYIYIYIYMYIWSLEMSEASWPRIAFVTGTLNPKP